MKTFTLTAQINTENPKAIKYALKELLPKGFITSTDNGFLVMATLKGKTAKDLNRTLLSALRRVERKTVLRTKWKSGGKMERFFDYADKGLKKIDS